MKMFREGWLQFFNDQIRWREEGICQLQNEVFRLNNDNFIVCCNLWRQVTFAPFDSYWIYRHDLEARRFDDEIGHLNTNIDRFKADIGYFCHEFGILEALSEVEDP